MKVRELMELIGASNLNPEANLDADISCGYACDLLSWVLAHGKAGMAWCTVQTHVNVIAVSVLMEMACVILVEGVEPEEASLKKAIDEEMPINEWLTGYLLSFADGLEVIEPATLRTALKEKIHSMQKKYDKQVSGS